MVRIQTWLTSSTIRLHQSCSNLMLFARKALFVAGIVCGVAIASMLFGLAIDASPASNIGMGPDWEYALADPTWWGIAEKLFTCMAAGYMLGIIPGGLLALLVAAWIAARGETMDEVHRMEEFFLKEEMFDLVDRDHDGKIRDQDLIAAHQSLACPSTQAVLQYTIRNRARLGMVEVLADGTATYSITRRNIADYPEQERERLRLIEWIGIASFVILSVTAFTSGIWAALGLALFAEAVAFYFLLKRKVRLQRFIQREFTRLDANADGVVDELEIVQLWPKLAESERPLLAKLHERVGDYGHEILRDGLTIRGVTRLEVDTCVPSLARMIV